MRLIDADELEKKKYSYFSHKTAKYRQVVFMGDVDHMPTIDAVPVVHGRWLFGTTMNREWMKCSECLVSQTPTGVFSYCPNCGARMDGSDE